MVKGIQTVVAVVLLTCIFGVTPASANLPSTKLTSLDVLQTSCMAEPQEFLYALRNGSLLDAKSSNKDLQSGGSAVFATSKSNNSHFQTEIRASIENGTSIVETTSISVEEKVPVAVTPTVTPFVTNGASLGGLDPEVLFSMANAHRVSLGLPAFEKNATVCGIAASRGPELNAEMANGTLHSGLYNDKHPFPVTENMISMRTNEEAFNWWLNSPVHRGQLQGNFKYACAVCADNTCALVFTNQASK